MSPLSRKHADEVAVSCPISYCRRQSPIRLEPLAVTCLELTKSFRLPALARLRSTARCIFDATMRKLYATDASVYREMPQAVALPKTEEDIRKLVAFARNHQHLADTRERLGLRWPGRSSERESWSMCRVTSTRIMEIDAKQRRVRVQPGVVRNELNLALVPHGVFFAPETSTQNRCMIGGMVGQQCLRGQLRCLRQHARSPDIGASGVERWFDCGIWAACLRAVRSQMFRRHA